MTKTKLNMGSGHRPLATPDNEWEDLDIRTNIDTHDHKPYTPDIVADCRNVPRKDETYEEILLHSVLEHFGKDEYMDVLQECYRLLRKGGALILSIPDMTLIARDLLENPWDTNLLNLIYGAQTYSENYHKWGWTEATIAKDLATIGFQAVTILPPQRYKQELILRIYK